MTTLTTHTVFVACNNGAYLDSLNAELNTHASYQLLGSSNNAQAFLKQVSSCLPDILIIDPLLCGSDAISFIGSLYKELMLEKTLVVVLSSMTNNAMLSALENYPRIRFIAMPTSPKNVVEKLDRYVRSDVEPIKARTRLVTDKQTVELAVSEYMLMLGVQPHLMGYKYLKYCIVYCVEKYSGGVIATKSVYKDIAQMLGVNVKNLERDMRHAIDVAWSRGSMYAQNTAFGNTLSEERGKPTNKEFIALLTEKIISITS